jgi:hypothetical protein
LRPRNFPPTAHPHSCRYPSGAVPAPRAADC